MTTFSERYQNAKKVPEWIRAIIGIIVLLFILLIIFI